MGKLVLAGIFSTGTVVVIVGGLLYCIYKFMKKEK